MAVIIGGMSSDADNVSTIVVHGLRDPLGSTTFTIDKSETSRCRLIAWRVAEAGGTQLPNDLGSRGVMTEPISLHQPGGVRVRLAMDQLAPKDSIAAFEIELPKRHDDGTWSAALQNLLGPTEDAALAEIAEKNAAAVVLEDKRHGRMELNRIFGCFVGQTSWASLDLAIHVESDNPDEAAAMLAEAQPIWDAADRWQQSLHTIVAERLLDVFNSQWREEDEAELTPEQFVKRIRPMFLTIADDAVCFECDDDDLFGGHRIKVDGTIANGLEDAFL